MNGYKYHVHQLPAGWIGLVASETGTQARHSETHIAGCSGRPGRRHRRRGTRPDYFAEVVDCLARYSEGDLSALDGIELDLDGVPPFFRAAWAACRTIPCWRNAQLPLAGGRGRQPQGHARRRAGHGPQPLFAHHPCHRVISSDGGLGGYGGGGLGVKARLLQMELDQASRES